MTSECLFELLHLIIHQGFEKGVVVVVDSESVHLVIYFLGGSSLSRLMEREGWVETCLKKKDLCNV